MKQNEETAEVNIKNEEAANINVKNEAPAEVNTKIEKTSGEKKPRRKRKIVLRIIGLIALVALIGIVIFLLGYYKADKIALSSMESDSRISVTKTDYGYFFDGPENDEALIFYPGAKVDERAYAPMLWKLANAGIDVCLIKTPFHLAVLRPNAADDVMAQYDYDTWYVGGHSMGGAIASMYAEKHASSIDAVIMLAAYPTGQMPDNQIDIVIYGENDGVLKLDKVEEGWDLVSGPYYENVIIGGNHANFGYYGKQPGDGKADISAKTQQDETVEYILYALERERRKQNGN